MQGTGNSSGALTTLSDSPGVLASLSGSPEKQPGGSKTSGTSPSLVSSTGFTTLVSFSPTQVYRKLTHIHGYSSQISSLPEADQFLIVYSTIMMISSEPHMILDTASLTI